jgi:8-oxo-dGTP pyrophosphatase MutT (NUDIX family)
MIGIYNGSSSTKRRFIMETKKVKKSERKEDKITDHKFVNLYKITDPENHVNGYMYAERLGKDSIAFICYDEGLGKVLVNKEYKPPVNEFITGAFGGSLDKDVSLEEIVRAEAKEEGGFSDIKEIQPIGKFLVSTQMNQFCHLYLVHVDRNDEGEREPENAIEAMAETIWIDESEVFALNDWKAITIATLSGLNRSL